MDWRANGDLRSGNGGTYCRIGSKKSEIARRLGMKPQGLTDKYYGQTADLFKITEREWAGTRVG